MDKEKPVNVQTAPALIKMISACILVYKGKTGKSLGEKADRLYALRQARYTVQHLAQGLERDEKDLKEELIEAANKLKGRGVAGKIARVTVENKPVGFVRDFPTFMKHVVKTGAYELLQKRLSTEALIERWDKGKTVPGVDRQDVATLSVEKLKS